MADNHAITVFYFGYSFENVQMIMLIKKKKDNVNKKTRKSKEEVKQEIISAIIDGERYENDKLNQKNDKVEKCCSNSKGI